MRRLRLSKDSEKFLRTLDAKQFRQVVLKIFALASHPVPHDSIDMGEGFRRADIGEFRIVYEFDEASVHIDTVGRRNDDAVYRQFRRGR